MKILLVGNFFYSIYSPAFEAGFKKLGHEVKCIKTNEYSYKNKIFCAFLNRIQSRFHVGLPLKKLNEDILKVANEYHPDFIFLYRCCSVWGKTVRDLKEKGFFVFTYNNDDPFSGIPSKHYYRHFLKTTTYADCNFVYRKKNIVDYSKFGINNAKVLLPYYLESENYHIACEDDIPIAFVGHFENDGRDKMLLSLKNNNLPVKVFSDKSQWRKSAVFNELEDIIYPSAHGKDYNLLLNRIQIALVFLSKINNDTYTRRCFEIPATATLMLSEYTDDMNELYPEDKCACYFRNSEELVDKCKFLLSNPQLINKIANDGHERLIEIGGSEYDRCKQIITEYKERSEIL